MVRSEFGFEFARLSALYRYGLLDSDPDLRFGRIVEALQDTMAIASVKMVVVDERRLFLIAGAGGMAVESRRDRSLCALTIEEPGPLMIDDVCHDARASEIGPSEIRAYLGVPLRTDDNQAIGVLYVADARPRSFMPADVGHVERAALDIMAVLDERCQSRVDRASGAMTRPAFEEMVQRVGDLALRQRQDLSVIVIDVDPFRARIESLNVDLGRLVIERMSALGRINVRRLDSFGRLSENVFAIMLPDTAAAGALTLADRLVHSLSEGWSALGIGVNAIGVGQASLRSGPCPPEALVARALDECGASVPRPSLPHTQLVANPRVA